ncbi:MAG: hypothetical protein IK093_12565 [Ruminiclostridium sp.]|nr:hypothetical protein [Ruminiclostridium sp.]
MYREQLHESFDRISPSPELLDRVSAMMREEAGRRKPPIRMQAVKYGGIAAALVIAAGATFAAVQSQTNGVKTETAAKAEINTDFAATNGANGGSADTKAETTAAAYEGVAEEAAEESAGAPEILLAKVDDSAANKSAADDESVIEYFTEGESAVDNFADEDAAVAGASEAAPAVTTTTAALLIAAEPVKVPDEYDGAAIAAEEDADDSDDEKFEIYNDDMIEESLYEEQDADSFPASVASIADDNSSGVTVMEAEGPDNMLLSESVDTAWENPATGAGTMVFEEPFVAEFYEIPLELQLKVDGVLKDTGDGSYLADDKTREYTEHFYKTKARYTENGDAIPAEPVSPGDYGTYPDITSIDDYMNAYTFIEYFGISDKDVREALAGIYTDEQINALTSGDKAAITAAFASEYAIVKGEKIYPPLWLCRHDTDEWTAAGITAEDLTAHYDALTHLPEWLVDKDVQIALTDKIDTFIKS